MEGVIFNATDHCGRTFKDFFPTRAEPHGPGWFVYGRNPDYYGGLVYLCGRPDVKPRQCAHYNGKVRRGWRTKREAAAVAARLNSGER